MVVSAEFAELHVVTVFPAQSDSSVTFAIEHANQIVVHFIAVKSSSHCERNDAKMKTTKSLRTRAFRFFGNGYALGDRADYLIELVAFGIIVIAVTLSLGNAMATH